MAYNPPLSAFSGSSDFIGAVIKLKESTQQDAAWGFFSSIMVIFGIQIKNVLTEGWPRFCWVVQRQRKPGMCVIIKNDRTVACHFTVE